MIRSMVNYRGTADTYGNVQLIIANAWIKIRFDFETYFNAFILGSPIYNHHHNHNL